MSSSNRMGKTENNYLDYYERIKEWSQRMAKMMMLINNGDYVFNPAKLSYGRQFDNGKRYTEAL